MKKLIVFTTIAFLIASCNNNNKGVPSTDSLHNDNIDQSDVNNRNLTKYDSSKTKGQTDTTFNPKSDSLNHK